jgi:hypothetical protein
MNSPSVCYDTGEEAGERQLHLYGRCETSDRALVQRPTNAEGSVRNQSHKNAEGSAVGWVNPVSLIERTEHQGDRPKTQERIGTGSGFRGLMVQNQDYA